MVTGATDGIGLVTAETLASMGATVVVVGRNRGKTEAVLRRIKDHTGNPSVDYLLADLTSQDQIRRLAKTFTEKFSKLHVLVNNAGGFFLTRQESVDGIEMTWALNHLSYFLLTNSLLDVILSSAPARIINVSSNAHYREGLDLDALGKPCRYNALRAYGRTKLANVLFTYQLARRLDGTGVTANILHPGLVKTNIGSGGGAIVQWGWSLFTRLRGGLTPEEGAQTSIYLATSPEVEGVSGKYFAKCKPVQSSPASYDQAAAKRLWEISEKMTGVG
jgi:NAD(P)-dependent dehydrogenase (short-subunit alcohol dehydrogenase family)